MIYSTRLIVGRRDPITRLNSLAGYRSQAPFMEVERVANAGHFLPQEERGLLPSGPRPCSPRHELNRFERARADTPGWPDERPR
jgi:pimeloyl-ACP methyl ester carboxylesterase